MVSEWQEMPLYRRAEPEYDLDRNTLDLRGGVHRPCPRLVSHIENIAEVHYQVRLFAEAALARCSLPYQVEPLGEGAIVFHQPYVCVDNVDEEGYIVQGESACASGESSLYLTKSTATYHASPRAPPQHNNSCDVRL